MRTNVIAAVASLALVLPAIAQEAPYYDEQAGAWSNAPPPPPADDGSGQQPNVDVSVDLATPGASANFETFQEGLAPYGEWVNAGNYGRVWRPLHVAAGWRPYYYGRWEWTDEGWLWVSDEPWGWAAYHYGRWAQDPYYGWVWIPGYQWAPAWVTWRYSPEYIGWAPLGPGFSVYVTSYPVVYNWWTFVPCHRFAGFPVHSVAYAGSYVRHIYGATQPAPPRAAVYGARAPAWGGPARPFVEQRMGRPITPVRVQPVASPGLTRGAVRAGVVPIYRPEARVAAPRAAPAPAAGAFNRSAPSAGAPAFNRGAPAPAFNRGAPAPAAQGFTRGAPAPGPQRPGLAAPAPARPTPQGSYAAPGSAAPYRPQGFAQPQRSAPGNAYTAPRPVARPPQQMAPPAARPPAAAPAPARPAPQGSYAPRSQSYARPSGFAQARPLTSFAQPRPSGGFGGRVASRPAAPARHR